MAGLLSAAMLAELRRPGRRVFPLLRLFYVDGTQNYASLAAASASLGNIAADVIAWGPITRVVSDRDNQITLNSATVVIADEDREFSSRLEGPHAGSLRGTRALIYLASPDVDPADWATVFDGYLEKWQMTALFQWTLSIHPNDQPLVNPSFPRTPILAIDWPTVGDRTLYSEFAPIIYGIHDSRGSSDTGMVPTLYVDRLGFRYLVAQGWVTVDRVYVDGVQTGSGFTIERPTINGRLFTLIDFVSDQGDSVITADVQGYEDQGDGGGTLLTGADCLQHALVNFVYGDYQGGLWASVGSVPVNTTAFATAQSFLTDMGWEKVSRRFSGPDQMTGMELIGEFCKSLQIQSFFTRDGLISVAAEDHRVTTQWYDEPRWLRQDIHEVGDTFRPDYDRDSIIDRLTVPYIYNEADGKYVQILEVRDPMSSEQNPDRLELRWSNASLV